MNPFLKQVADHYYSEGSISDKCFVFPNRRSMAFFVKYLREAVAESAKADPDGTKPLLMPCTLTINDFFYRIHGSEITDRVTLILELYECYRQLYPQAESLDEFISWGEVILGDFADVDKNLVDADMIFANVADFKAMEDDCSYMTEEQKAAIRRFLGYFQEGKVRRDSPKEKFVSIWNILRPLYHSFRERLLSAGYAYDGMVYRSLVEKLRTGSVTDVFAERFPGVDSFVFVGLNALNECESAVLKKMRDAGLAQFCWDFPSKRQESGSGRMIRDMRNLASVYMKRNLELFPQAFEMDPEVMDVPRISVVSVPSGVGQAKILPEILRRLAVDSHGGDLARIGTDTAVVLPDESLLMPVLNSIPLQIGDINVTMGYPMRASAFYSLMMDLVSMQVHIRQSSGEPMFYHRQVWEVLGNSVFKKALDSGGESLCRAIISSLRHYIPMDMVRGSAVMELVFDPVVKDVTKASADTVEALEDYLLRVIEGIAGRILDDPDMAIEAEFARRFHSCVQLLKGKRLEILPATFVNLLSQLVGPESVPYEGEPLRGFQIMGPLETRALDFDNLVILSCNEGVFPKRSSSPSFIPPELRKGFGLPTGEFKDAILAYCFYRLLQRAGNVWLVYDSRTEGLKSGEESRYIKQLRYHFRVPMDTYIAKAGNLSAKKEEDIEKPEDIESIVKGKRLSPSTLKNYLDCPVKFYYSFVLGLSEEEEVAETIDGRLLGSVYHDTMQAIYLGEAAMDPSFPMDRREVEKAVREGRLVPLRSVSVQYIDSWLGKRDAIRDRITALMKAYLHSMEVGGRDLVTCEVILRYVEDTLKYDRKLLVDKGLSSFEIIGLEMKGSWSVDGFGFMGYMDRVDSFGDGTVRILDYKTGRVSSNEKKILEGKMPAGEIVEKMFGEKEKDRPKIALQMFLYDMYADGMPGMKGRSIANVIYQPAEICAGQQPREKGLPEDSIAPVMEGLRRTLAEMIDPAVPFRRPADSGPCAYCDFRDLCGR